MLNAQNSNKRVPRSSVIVDTVITRLINVGLDPCHVRGHLKTDCIGQINTSRSAIPKFPFAQLTVFAVHPDLSFEFRIAAGRETQRHEPLLRGIGLSG